VLFDILHTTCYSYSQPVFLEPHTFRLQPRGDGNQQLIQHQLSILPLPVGQTLCLDAEGNTVLAAWFQGLHSQLAISVQMRVRTLRTNPFDFLLGPDNCRLPVRYSETEQLVLAPALLRTTPLVSDPVGQLASRLRGQAGAEVMTFLGLLNEHIRATHEVIHRPEGEPWQPADTLVRREGACRDLTVLLLDACRAMGLAGRFVSGYAESDGKALPELHAWAEVYLPGAGWRGFDPTLGLAVADRHVALAAAVTPGGAAPVAGTFRGSATAVMQTQVQVLGSREEC
jgi:transglutaminase-like putative cysteine protease